MNTTIDTPKADIAGLQLASAKATDQAAAANAASCSADALAIEIRKRCASTNDIIRMEARGELAKAEEAADRFRLDALRADELANSARAALKEALTSAARARLKKAFGALALKLKPLQPLADELHDAIEQLAMVAGEHAVDRTWAWSRLQSAKADPRDVGEPKTCETCKGTGRSGDRVIRDGEVVDLLCPQCQGNGHEQPAWRLGAEQDSNGFENWIEAGRAAGFLE